MFPRNEGISTITEMWTNLKKKIAALDAQLAKSASEKDSEIAALRTEISEAKKALEVSATQRESEKKQADDAAKNRAGGNAPRRAGHCAHLLEVREVRRGQCADHGELQRRRPALALQCRAGHHLA